MISYKNLEKKFLKYIQKVSSFYIYFWTTLLMSNQGKNDQFTKIKDCGTELESKKKQIEEMFTELQHIKVNNVRIIKYYSDYLGEVINDYENDDKLKRKIKDILQNEQFSFNQDKEVDYYLNNTINTDEFQFILISASKNNFCTILNISLELSGELGYSKKEILGKQCDIFMPSIIQDIHREMLKQKVNEYKNKEIQNNNINLHLNIESFQSFLLTKAKFLIPYFFSPDLMVNEFNDIFFIVKLSPCLINYQNKSLNSCYVFTNTKLKIENYSSNAMKLLALEQKDIFGRNQIYIGNYINNIDSSILKNSNKSKISWAKKTKDYNINSDFQCITTPIKILDTVYGYLLTFTLDDEYLFHKNKFDNNFIPTSNLTNVFRFDYTNHKYFLTQEKKDILSDELKNKLISLVNKYKENSNSNSSTTENEEEQSEIDKEESSEYTSSHAKYSHSSDNSSTAKLNKKNTSFHLPDTAYYVQSLNETEKKGNILTKEIEGEYYKVNTKDVKYFIYDYNRKSYLEVKKNFEMDQVKYRINQFSQPHEEIKEEHNLEKQKISKEEKKQYEDTKLKESQQKLLFQIKQSINKNESITIISFLYICSIIIFLILIGEGVFTLIFFKTILNKANESCTLIDYSYKILSNCISTIFFVRELTLLSMDGYIITYQDNNNYRKDVIDNLKNIGETTQNMIEHILTTFISLNKENEKIFYHNTLKMYMIADDLSLFQFNLTINAALSQVLSSMFSIIYLDIEEIIPSHREVYFTFFNCLNALYAGLITQANVFSN